MQTRAVESLEDRVLLAMDLGDAPDPDTGTGIADYQTILADGGPAHVIDGSQLTLFLGASVDADDGTLQNSAANADDVDAALPDDEDGVLNPLDLRATVGSQPTVTLLVTNTTGAAATLSGWIDYNRNGVFENELERAQATIAAGQSGTRVRLDFAAIPAGAVGRTYARFRLSTDAAASDAVGTASDGEVEDYVFTITERGSGNVGSFQTIASSVNGGPVLADHDYFGTSAVSPGDLDGDGVSDLAIGAFTDDTGGNNRGAVHILFLNTDGSVRESTRIASGTHGGPLLSDGDVFGIALAAPGDLNGDGIGDLVVGSDGNDTGGNNRGAVHVVFLDTDGSVKSSTMIAHLTNGGPTLSDSDHFGRSVTSIGDHDGDGIGDLVIGAWGDDTGGEGRGAVYVVFLNSDGTARTTSRIAHGVNGGPSLADEDGFGLSVASIGDLNGDDIGDIVVGAGSDNTGGTDRGGIHVVFLDADGRVKSSRRIAHQLNGGPTLVNSDYFGFSITSVGDLDGDGIDDLVVGADSDDTGGSNRGAVHVLYMNRSGSVRDRGKIASGLSGAPTLDNGDFFGSSVLSPGDLNDDGIGDLIVGARYDDTGGSNRGAIHVLFLDGPLAAPNITGPAAETGNQRPVISWDAVPLASEYDVWIRNQSTGVNPFRQATVTGTSFTPQTDLGIGRFNVWVRAKTTGGPGQWSAQYNFRINTAAAVDDPGRYLDTHRPTLTWDALPGAVRYDLWIDDQLNGVSQFVRDQNVPEAHWTAPADMPLGLYRAWVRGYSADNLPGMWSTVTLFYVMPSPVVTQGMNSTFDRTPTFVWDPLPGATHFEVYVADRNVGTQPPYLYQQNIIGQSFTVPATMPDGPYRAWVIGISAANVRSYWTSAMDFYVGGRTEILTPPSEVPTVLLEDDFDTFDTARWNVDAQSLSNLGAGTWLGAPNVIDPMFVDGQTMLRLQSTLDNQQRRGIATHDSFALAGARIELDFKIMPLVPGEPPDNVDGILELSLINPVTTEHFYFRLYGGNFGATPNVQGGASLDGVPYSSADGVWAYNTRYRFVVEDIGSQTRASLRNTQDETIVSHDFNFDLAAMGPVQIGLAQVMGSPNLTRMADVAVDRLRVESLNDPTPEFTWRPVDGAEHYELWVDQVGGTQQFIHELTLAGTNFTPAAPLPVGQYRVWVRAVSTEAETSPWSTLVAFAVE